MKNLNFNYPQLRCRNDRK